RRHGAGVGPHVEEAGGETKRAAAVADGQRGLRTGRAGWVLADADEHVGVAGAEDVQVAGRAGRAHTDLAARGDVDGAGRSAGSDTERKARAPGHVADEEVRFVAGHVPRL